MKHTLVVIGYTGDCNAYLDVPKEEALKRFEEKNWPLTEGDTVRVLEFEDEFWTYAASGPDAQVYVCHCCPSGRKQSTGPTGPCEVHGDTE